jgi:hypothetical protein
VVSQVLAAAAVPASTSQFAADDFGRDGRNRSGLACAVSAQLRELIVDVEMRVARATEERRRAQTALLSLLKRSSLVETAATDRTDTHAEYARPRAAERADWAALAGIR